MRRITCSAITYSRKPDMHIRGWYIPFFDIRLKYFMDYLVKDETYYSYDYEFYMREFRFSPSKIIELGGILKTFN